ncbi:hypothetical protein ABGB18_44770 [Nonomuraea sp. B12E4]|uniref:hypothetical protein n=1 Tax=Nonomuraea sp. B12E4 TaxID=3153564 RepID=UPI00325EFDF0
MALYMYPWEVFNEAAINAIDRSNRIGSSSSWAELRSIENRMSDMAQERAALMLGPRWRSLLGVRQKSPHYHVVVHLLMRWLRRDFIGLALGVHPIARIGIH